MNVYTERPEPVIEKRDAFLVVGTLYVGKNKHREIPAMWGNDFLPRMNEIARDTSHGCISYGVCREAPEGSEPGVFEYLAALPVESFDNLPEGMVGWEIPTQTYAVIPVYGLSDLNSALSYMYNEWLPNSNEYEHAPGPMFELYPETFNSDESTLYIYAAVRRKS